MESNRTDRPDLRNPGGIILSQAGQSGPIRADCNFASNASRAQSPGYARWGNIPNSGAAARSPLKTPHRGVFRALRTPSNAWQAMRADLRNPLSSSLHSSGNSLETDGTALPNAGKRIVSRAMTQSHRIHYTTDTKRKIVPVNVKRTTSFAQRHAFFMIRICTEQEQI